MSRDWSKAFDEASFKGVPFWVRREGFSGGRRISVQHLAYGETPVTEDFGGQETGLPNVIYVAGDEADGEAGAMIAAFRSPGPGLLRLPMFGGFLAHCESFDMGRTLNRNGFVSCSVQFVAVGAGGAGIAGTTINQVLADIRGFAANLAGAF